MAGIQFPLYILCAAILWGTTGTAQAFAPENAHPAAIGAVRLAIGAAALLAAAAAAKKLRFKNWPLKTVLLAAVCMALYQPLFFSAVMTAGIAVGTVVAIGSAPVSAGVLEWMIYKKRPSRLWICSTALSVAGCLLLFANKDSAAVSLPGILLAAGAGLAFAGYTFVSRSLVQTNDSLSAAAVTFSVSALLLLPLLLFFDNTWIASTRGIAVSLHLGIIATGFAYFLFSKGLAQVSSAAAVTLSLAEPMTAALLGVFIVGETLSLTAWLGIVLLLTGIGVLVLGEKRRKPAGVVLKQ